MAVLTGCQSATEAAGVSVSVTATTVGTPSLITSVSAQRGVVVVSGSEWFAHPGFDFSGVASLRVLENARELLVVVKTRERPGIYLWHAGIRYEAMITGVPSGPVRVLLTRERDHGPTGKIEYMTTVDVP